MTRVTRRRRTPPPALPCLTIARSPANDARVILDAFVSTPALVRFLDSVTGGAGATQEGAWDGWVGEHRAELRAMLQHLTKRLQGVIEGASGDLGAMRAASAARTTSAEPVAPPAPADSTAREEQGRDVHHGRPAVRQRASRVARLPSAAAEPWPGGPLLR